MGSTIYGVSTNYERNAGRARDYVDIWTGPFMEEWAGSGVSLPKGDGYMVTTRAGAKVRVTCPTPRTDETFRQVDEAIEAALNAHDARRTRTTTRGVDVTITAELFPAGTVYGGGPKSYRYPDAGPVEETPTPGLAAALAELGSVGTAIEWATTRNLLHFEGAERAEAEDSSAEPVDRFVFEGSMSVDEWREFAGIYLVSIDEETGEPDHAETDEPQRHALPGGKTMTTRSWRDWSDSMDWNVGGLSKVNGARIDVTMWEMTEPA